MSGYQRKDSFYARAKAGGYRARSAYKLQELDDRYRLLRRGARVVDLGAWPGAWLQVASERIGPDGRAVGIDLVAIDALGPQVATLVGDIRDRASAVAIRDALGGPADVVLCDIAPKLTGIRATDEARREELTDAVLVTLPAILTPGGAFLAKLFMDQAYQATLKALRGSFEQVKATRPEATRKGSAELYVICNGFRPADPPCG